MSFEPCPLLTFAQGYRNFAITVEYNPLLIGNITSATLVYCFVSYLSPSTVKITVHIAPRSPWTHRIGFS